MFYSPGDSKSPGEFSHNFTFLNLSEFAITDTELKLMAAAAIIGDNKIPNTGNKAPAAIGTPITL